MFGLGMLGRMGTPGFAKRAPVASSVSITGTTTEGQTLTGHYTYTDPQGLPESGTTYQWVRADDTSGTNAANIASATALTYILQAADVNKYVKFTVTPKNGYVFGSTASSAYSGPIASAGPISFTPVAYTGNGTSQTVVTGIDLTTNEGLVWIKSRSGTQGHRWTDTVRLVTNIVGSSSTAAQTTEATGLTAFTANGFSLGASANYNQNTTTYIAWAFQSTSNFFDIVSYSGDGLAGHTVAHNLGVVPQLLIVKRLDSVSNWSVYTPSITSANILALETTAAMSVSTTRWNSTDPTSAVFTLGTSTMVNASGGSYIAYLFGNKAGTSSISTYTGTGAQIDIDCGFAAAARFVLIKRTDSSGDWYIWDSVRGISSGNDPYLLANSTAVEATSTNYVDAFATGFTITAAAPAALNAIAGIFVYLAIA